MFKWLKNWLIRRKIQSLHPSDVISFERETPDIQKDDPAELSPFADPFDGFAVEMPIEDFIDLHTFAPSDTREVLDAYLDAALEKGYPSVRIIHGRGSGVQRRITQSYLEKHPCVTRFYDAPAEAGGWGATIAYLE